MRLSETITHERLFATLRLPPIPQALLVDCALALAFALLWWGVAMLLLPTEAVNILTDQHDIFMPAGRAIANPYMVGGYFNPPWAAALLAPFSWLPLSLSALAQLALYFVLLTLIIHKFGGGRSAVLLTLTSFIALNSATELNVEWMVCIGLLVPTRWSLPFLLIKPQTALGYVLSFRWRDWVYAVLYALIFGFFALLLWGHLIPQMIDQAAKASGMLRAFNAAPMALIGAPLSLVIGILLAGFGLRRRDPALGILAGMFFMPYLALYGMLLHLALLATRAPRAALIASLVIWVIFGGMLSQHLWTLLAR